MPLTSEHGQRVGQRRNKCNSTIWLPPPTPLLTLVHQGQDQAILMPAIDLKGNITNRSAKKSDECCADHCDLNASITTESSHVCYRPPMMRNPAKTQVLNSTMSSLFSTDDCLFTSCFGEISGEASFADCKQVQPVALAQTPKSSKKESRKERPPKLKTIRGGEKLEPPIELHDWIIQPLPDVRGVCVEGKKKGEEDFWHSSSITDMKKGKLVKTASGTVYRLRGKINMLCTIETGFPKSVAQAFSNGFPPNWKEILKNFYMNLEQSISVFEECSIIRGRSLKKLGGMKKAKPVKKKPLDPMAGNSCLDSILTPAGLVKRSNPVEIFSVTRSGRLSLPPLARWQGQRYEFSAKTNTLNVGFQTAAAERALINETKHFMRADKRFKMRMYHKSHSMCVTSPSSALTTSFELTQSQHSKSNKSIITKLCNASTTEQEPWAVKSLHSDEKKKSEKSVNLTKRGTLCSEDIGSFDECVVQKNVLEDEKLMRNVVVSLTDLSKSSKVTKSPGKDDGNCEQDSNIISKCTNKSKNKATHSSSALDLNVSTDQSRSNCSPANTSMVLRSKNKIVNNEIVNVNKSLNTTTRRANKFRDHGNWLDKKKDADVNSDISVDSSHSDCNLLSDSIVLRTKQVPRDSIFTLKKSDKCKSNAKSRKSISKSPVPSVSSSSKVKNVEKDLSQVKSKKSVNSERCGKSRKRKRESSISEDTGYCTEQGSLKLQQDSTPKSCGRRHDRKRRKLSLENHFHHQPTWTNEEKVMFEKALKTVDGDTSDFWYQMSNIVKSRTEQECREYHTMYLDGKIKKGNRVGKTHKLTRKPSGREKGDPVCGGKGTLKRREGIREFLSEQNDDYEDNLFDGTPFRSKKMAVPFISDIDFDKDDSEIFGSNHNFITPMTKNNTALSTPCTTLRAQPASTRKTPSTQVNHTVNDTPVAVVRHIADKYIHTFMNERKKTSSNDSEGYGMGCTDVLMSSVSPSVIVYDKETEKDENDDDDDENNPYVYYWDEDDNE